MIEYLAAILPLGSLFIYAVLLSIECGAAIFVSVPELLGSKELVRAYINPVWETTNVFLIFAFVSIIAFFPGALPAWGRALIVPFFAFLAFMGLRAIGMLYFFYKGGKNRAMKLLFLVAALGAPAVLAGGILPYLLTGNMPYGPMEWLLAADGAVLAIFFLLVVSSSFFAYLADRKGLRAAAHLRSSATISLLFFVAALAFSFPVIGSTAPHLIQSMLGYLPALCALIIIEFIITILAQGRKGDAARFWSGIVFFGFIFFGVAFSELPYLVYPSLTIYNTFTDPGAATAMLGIFAVGALITLPALVLLYYLFV